MGATGIIKKVDDLGRVAIPKAVREKLAIKEGESLEVFIEDGAVVFRKYNKDNSTEDIVKQTDNDITNDELTAERDELFKTIDDMDKALAKLLRTLSKKEKNIKKEAAFRENSNT